MALAEQVRSGKLEEAVTSLESYLKDAEEALLAHYDGLERQTMCLVSGGRAQQVMPRSPCDHQTIALGSGARAH